MATGMEYMLKSMLGIDPEEIKQGAAQMQQALQSLIAQYKSDQTEHRAALARIESKLDILLQRDSMTANAAQRVIASEQKYDAVGNYVQSISYDQKPNGVIPHA